MNIAYQDHPAFLNPLQTTRWLAGSLTPVDGGYVVTLPDGTVLSVQPDGSYQTRPAGTAGPWEVCQVDQSTNVLRFHSGASDVLPAGIAYAVPFHG
jgi:hypothetical protein